MTLEKLLSKLNYLKEIEDAVKIKFDKNIDKIKQIAETAYNGEDFKFQLCNRMPLTRLVIITYLLLQKYNDYKALNIPDKIIFDTFSDVSLRAKLYYQKTGKAGITKDDVIWFRHIINTAIFKIGVLQYQPFEMIYLDEETIGEQYMSFSSNQKEMLPAGSPVINCHIQYGADLNRNSVDISLKYASTFFTTYFPHIHYKAFLCYSWLLYPPMTEQLNSKSNIKQFADKFTIIGYCNDSSQAIENLFFNSKKELKSNSTSLQKMAINNIKTFGYGCGIIYI